MLVFNNQVFILGRELSDPYFIMIWYVTWQKMYEYTYHFFYWWFLVCRYIHLSSNMSYIKKKHDVFFCCKWFLSILKTLLVFNNQVFILGCELSDPYFIMIWYVTWQKMYEYTYHFFYWWFLVCRYIHLSSNMSYIKKKHDVFFCCKWFLSILKTLLVFNNQVFILGCELSDPYFIMIWYVTWQNIYEYTYYFFYWLFLVCRYINLSSNMSFSLL